jgi:hypothetical protein
MSLKDIQCTCPHCGESFNVADALSQLALEELRQGIASENDENIQRLIQETREIALQEGVAQATEKANAAVQNLVTERTSRITELEARIIALNADMQANQETQNQRIANAVSTRETELATAHQLQLQEHENKIQQLTQNLERTTGQLQTSHAQSQGEVGEIAVKDALTRTFPSDHLEEVVAGARGADWLLRVKKGSEEIGKIIFEVKNAQNWSNAWITKLKQDQASKGAQFAVLVTTVFPAQMTKADLRDGVWVCGFQEYLLITRALRETLFEVSRAKVFEAGRADNANRLYDFIQSVEFKHAMEALIAPVNQMDKILQTEKRAIQRSWKQREKLIEDAIENAASVLGALSGVAPEASIPQIEAAPSMASLALDEDTNL